MSKKFQSVRGMNDFSPEQTRLWRRVERALVDVLDRYGYGEVRMPIVEKTELFKRSIGEVTDIVEKEMYTFPDQSDQMLSLRPEGTASCVRAGIENGWLYNQIRKFWYMGPMFRYENPQAGRYRQFHQLGVEVFGLSGPDIDAEMLIMCARFWEELGLQGLTLNINSLGTSESRQAYRALLVQYFQEHENVLDDDSKRRLQSNPMRILDSKNPAMADMLAGAPKLIDHIDAESAEHFSAICKRLEENGVDYVVNARLVRGLDYYSRTVFEWATSDLGAQDTVCGGGRYDALVTELGGQATPALGFAIGLERLLLLLEQQSAQVLQQVPAGEADVYIAAMGADAERAALKLAEQLRGETRLRVLMNCSGGKFAKQLKRADASGAQYALIIGQDEYDADEITVKPLRAQAEQLKISQADVVDWLNNQ